MSTKLENILRSRISASYWGGGGSSGNVKLKWRHNLQSCNLRLYSSVMVKLRAFQRGTYYLLPIKCRWYIKPRSHCHDFHYGSPRIHVPWWNVVNPWRSPSWSFMIPGDPWWSGNGHECFELFKTSVAFRGAATEWSNRSATVTQPCITVTQPCITVTQPCWSLLPPYMQTSLSLAFLG